MFGSARCGYCARARTLLGEKGVAFEEIDVDASAGAREEMIVRSGGGGSTVPQIFINDRHIGGAPGPGAPDAARRPAPPPELGGPAGVTGRVSMSAQNNPRG